MIGSKLPSTRDLARRLSEAEATIDALLSGQIDAVVDSKSQTPVLLAKAQAALREERDRAQRYLDTADVILVALDLNGRITLINRKGCELLGCSERELIGADWTTCVPARTRDALRDRFASLINGDLTAVESSILSRSGHELLIEWRSVLLRDDAGHVTGTFSSGTDITERQRAVEALRTAEERMRFAMQSADVGVWDLDCVTGSLCWSETIEAHYGLKPGSFPGTFEAFIERIHPDDRESMRKTIREATKSGTEFSVVNRSIWPDGTVRWLNTAGRIILAVHGEPVRGVGISLDVTARRSLEEQYQQAQKMEAVGQLAGGVAHDFNNLVSVILGQCELLLLDSDTRERRQARVAQIQKASLSAASLTRQLLAFSRKQIIQSTPVELNATVAHMRNMLGRLIGEDIEVVLNLRPDLALVSADRGQVEQILMNLAVNARDAMPRGGILTIETCNVDLDEHDAHTHSSVTPGAYVMLAVSDTGTGMTPEVQARVFEPFFTTKEVGKGTGLGMASVHSIVARSGGGITVYSEVGRGTTFKLYFPRADALEMAPGTVPPVAESSISALTVLLVEDQEGLREVARELLERQGHTVLCAANAAEALEFFEEHASIGVLLTDVVMPGTSGPALARRLVERRPALKVIYMSGYTEDTIIHHGVLNPGIAFLAKPFSSEALGQKLREVLHL